MANSGDRVTAAVVNVDNSYISKIIPQYIISIYF